MAEATDETEGARPGRIEEAAGKQLGVERWDRPGIFREAAEAAVDNDLAYWLVLGLSGAIATLGLAMSSSAVVIGAMLVAPLLGPMVGLSLALAVGDGRLAVQVGAVVLGSTVAVVVIAALLTLALPFQSVTPEIASRTRPTTLDLAVAVFSGLVGALVTLERGSRLSAAIPGVAVAVALIPPLAAAGFGMGAGWQTDIILGSMLLYGANLAGIVLSGMAVFMLVGMHRKDVTEAARSWNAGAQLKGVARVACGLPWVRRLGVFGSATGRVLLVLAFAGALAIPLTASLQQVVREFRVRGAVSAAEEGLRDPGRTSILGRSLTFGDGSTRARIRVATAVWVDEERRETFERTASERAGEPVVLVLEQLPATAGGIEDLAGILPSGRAAAVTAAPQPLPEITERARRLVGGAVEDLPFPAGAWPVGATVVMPPGGEARLEVAYLSAVPLQPQTLDVLGRALSGAVGDPDLQITFVLISSDDRPLDDLSDAIAADSLATLLSVYPALRLELMAGEGVDSAAVEAAEASLQRDTALVGRVVVRRVDGEGIRVRLRSEPPRRRQGG